MNTDTTQDYLHLAKYAFHKEITGGDQAFYKLLEFAKVYSHHENDALSSMLIELPFNVFWKQEIIKMAGVGYVASYPEARGNGAIRKLMTQMLKDEYQKGTALSYLAPFSYHFYEKFGYAYAFDRKYYQLKATLFPQGDKGSGTVRRTSLDDSFEALEQIHHRAFNQGSIARDREKWEYYFAYKSHPYFAIYEEKGKKTGYLIYEFEGQTFVIKELIALTTAAKEALYHFISSHAGAFETISWLAPINEKLEQEVKEPAAMTIEIKPYMMARIVNLSEFLKVNGQPDFSVEIRDDLIPENNQVIGAGDAPTQKMTIGAFTAEMLRKNGSILREYF